MGSYFMCPACKAANEPCTALNCDAWLRAVGHNMGRLPSEWVAVPALIYPPSLWTRVKQCAKRVVVAITQYVRSDHAGRT